MPTGFTHDVFLSHSSRDKAVVRDLATRLKRDGVRVWFDEWEIRIGDSIPAKIEEGLERSRLLILCMSANAFGSDWATLESQTFRFRDPLNKERRFIPLKLDDHPPKGSLAQFLHLNWQVADDAQYSKLLEVCRPAEVGGASTRGKAPQPSGESRAFSLGNTDRVWSVALSGDGRRALSGSDDNTVRLWDVESGRCLSVLEGHTARVSSVALSGDGRRALSSSSDNTVRLWDVESSRCLGALQGHTGRVWSVALSGDGRRALSGSSDNTVRLWDVESGGCLRVLLGHTARVLSVALSGDGRRALSGSSDNTVRLWDVENGTCLRVLPGHTDRVWSVALSGDGHRALSGSSDNTVRLWDVESGRCLRALGGHAASVWSVALSGDGRRALSGSDDNTVRLWDVESGRCLHVLEGHADSVLGVALSGDGRRALTGSSDNTVRLWGVESGRCLGALEGHTAGVLSVALSGDGRRALSGSSDNTVRLWNVESGGCLRVLEGHADRVLSVALSGDGRRALSGSSDNAVRLWDVESGGCLHVLEGHTDSVWSVVLSGDGRRALSGSSDNTVRLWDVESGGCLRVLEGHTGSVWSVALSASGRRALSGSSDNTVRLWDVESGGCLRVLEGHTARVLNVALSSDGRRALSGSFDNTVRLWDVEGGGCLRVLEGHTARVLNVALSDDGRRALSGSFDNTVRLWDVESGDCLRVLEGHTARVLSVALSNDGRRLFSASINGVLRLWNLDGATASRPSEADEQLQYTNAKVMLVGEGGAGKTGLAMRLARKTWQPSQPTVGAWATQWEIPIANTAGLKREIWLWDFGGQADQRLIHQLYMEETAVAVLVFDPQKEDLFERLGDWDRDLTRATKRPFAKLLAAGRVDLARLRVSRNEVLEFARKRGFSGGYIETSAATGEGCQDLEKAILEAIRWEELPWRTSPRLFMRLKEEIIRLKDAGRVLMQLNELRTRLELTLADEGVRFSDEQLKAVIRLLSGPGVVWELGFGSWVLLQPEVLNAYAQAVVQTLRADPDERGCIVESRVLLGELRFPPNMRRLGSDEERIALLAMHQLLVERGLCLRDHDEEQKRPTVLTFPSYFRRERPELPRDHPGTLVSYRFKGFLDDVYASLVVRLHHSEPFRQKQLWRYAADFTTATGKRLGIKLTPSADGVGELEIYFERGVSPDEMVIFATYVQDHLRSKAGGIVRLRHYLCPHCGTAVANRDVAMKKLDEGKPDILCVECEKRVPLKDELEQRFASPELRERARLMKEQSSIALDNESRERALVGEVITTASLAGQIARELPVDHGIDMEIEFKSDLGEPTGKKLYLELKSVDSLFPTRQEDGGEIFQLTKREVHGWMEQAFPVLLVVRDSTGEVRWMEARDWLRRESDDGRRPISQIVFAGERFDVMSVRRWRDRMLVRL